MNRQRPSGSGELVAIACLFVCSHPEVVICFVNLVIPVISSSRAHMIRNCKGRMGKLLWKYLSPPIDIFASNRGVEYQLQYVYTFGRRTSNLQNS
jgi:hypothetical protein